MLRVIALAYDRPLPYRSALHVSALGSFGNAAGGLPIGTALKFIILYKQAGLRIAQVTTGLAAFTAGISLVLLGYASFSSAWLDLPTGIRLIPPVLLAMAVLVLAYLRRRYGGTGFFREIASPLLTPRVARQLGVFSLITGTLFIVNYLVICMFLLPEFNLVTGIFVASVGILVGLGTLMQSTGGIQELSIGLTTLLTGGGILDGVQLALTMRMTSILSSALILALLYTTHPRVTAPSR